MRICHALIVLFCAARLVTAAEALPEELSGDGLSVRFEDKAGRSGTIRFKEKPYPFTAEFKDNKLAGVFKVGGDSYPFTIRQEEKGFVFETANKTYALTPVARNPLGAGGDLPARPPAAPGNAVVMTPAAMRDAKSGLDVGTLLVPEGWVLKSDVVWRPTAAQFVTLQSAVFDPRSGRALRWIAGDRFHMCPIMFQAAVQQGIAPVSGGMELCDAVMSPQDYVQKVVVPRYRRVPGTKVVAAEELKELGAAIEQSHAADIALARQTGHEIHYVAGKVRLEYPGPGDGVMQEDVYCVLAVAWDPQANARVQAAGQPGAVSVLFWPEQLYSFTAPKGQLEQAAPLLQGIASSFRPTLQWDAYVQNIAQMMQQAAIDDHMMDIAAKKQITETQKKTFEDRQKSMDHISDQVGHLISGTQAFKNPIPGKPPIVVPAGTKAWINPQGQVVYSHDTQYDPGTAPNNNSTWSQLKDEP